MTRVWKFGTSPQPKNKISIHLTVSFDCYGVMVRCHHDTSNPYILDSVLSVALEMRQKYQNIVLILKQSNMMEATTTYSASELHCLLVRAVEMLYLPRSNHRNAIIMIHSSNSNGKLQIRCIASSAIFSGLVMRDHGSTVQSKVPQSQIVLTIP